MESALPPESQQREEQPKAIKHIARLLENVKFRDIKDDFIQALEKDKKRVDASKNVLVFTDKARNLYEMKTSTYNKLVTENAMKTYKHAKDNTMNEINKELKNIADKLNISKLHPSFHILKRPQARL